MNVFPTEIDSVVFSYASSFLRSRAVRHLAVFVLLWAVPSVQVLANSYDVGVEDEAQFVQAQPVFAPEPKIPDSLKEDSLKASCLVRFTIKANGKTTVKLLTSSGSDDVDDLTLKTLQQWKFLPATLDAKPTDSVRKIKVEFEVQ